MAGPEEAAGYLTPGELGITPDEYAALLWVRGELQGGGMVHVSRDDIYGPEKSYPPEGASRMFNMLWWHSPLSCGTVCCIGGWMDSYLGSPPGSGGRSGSRKYSEVLHNLFYPPFDSQEYRYDEITADMAARAITAFLCTGRVSWRPILGLNSPAP
jgi:hypothetical protein